MTRRLRGVCVACRKDLFIDPVLHYASDGHLENVARAERREAKQRAGRRLTDKDQPAEVEL